MTVLSSRDAIKGYLGYPSFGTAQVQSVENQLDKVEQIEDCVVAINAILVRLDTLSEQLFTDGADAAGIKSLGKGDIEFFGGESDRIEKTCSQCRRLVKQLSVKTGIKIVDDYFGSSVSSSGLAQQAVGVF